MGNSGKEHISVLLIDDDPEELIITRQLLARAKGLQAELAWAGSFEEGLAEVLTGRYDVCLADYHLGEHHGIDLVREAVSRGCPTPIILLTGQGGLDVDLRAMEAGAADYLVKGSTGTDQLERAIRYARERRRSEDRYREGERRFRAVFEATFQFMAVLNPEGTVLEVNQRSLELTGLQREAVIGCALWDCDWWQETGNDRTEVESAVRRARAGETIRYEARLRAADGEVAIVDFAVKPVVSESGDVELLVAEGHDITARVRAQEEVEALNRELERRVAHRTAQLQKNNKRLEREIAERISAQEQLLKAIEELESANQAKSTFITNLSHDIRTPLTTIIGYADVMAEGGSAHDKEIARLIRTGSHGLLRTLDSVLDLARLEGRQVRLHPIPLYLAGEAKDAIEMFKGSAGSNGVQLRVRECQPDIWAELDRAALARALMNLVGNAVKFTPKGEVCVEIDGDDASAVVRVVDTGIGIRPEFLPHVFEVFQQEARQGDSPIEGSGLGLSITRQLVEIMGGQIDVESEPGRGTTFTVRFARIPVLGSAGDSGPEVMLSENGRRDARILVVEDDPQTRALYERLLRGRYHVDIAADSETARPLLQNGHYHALIVDINLGRGRTGVDLLRMVRGLPGYNGVPIVACTAYALPGNREKFLNLGFDEYLSKPFTLEQLRQTLNRILQ